MRLWKRVIRAGYRFAVPVLNIRELPRLPVDYFFYARDMYRYSKLKSAETLSILNHFPCVHDNTGSNPFDPHYFYQDVWAFKQVLKLAPSVHVDVGSTAIFVGMLSAIVDVTFVDIRPLRVKLDRYSFRKGSILEMPFADGSIDSLSCLHVAEHIGLGRYGDPLDADGTKKAAAELSRVLAPGGRLLFSVPIGRSRVEFNAHRIHSAAKIVEYFSALNLLHFSGVDDKAIYQKERSIDELDDCEYGCGFFVFTKPKRENTH